MHLFFKFFVSTIVIFLTASQALVAQSTKASVEGRILDQDAATVTGVRVTLRSKETDKATTFVTNTDGAYRFNELPSGEYELTATARGFSVIRQTISLRSGDTPVVDLTLQPSSVAETVVVSSNSLLINGERIERTPGAVDIIDSKTLESSRVLSSSEALRKVAGLNVRDEEGFGLRPNIGIRGLNPTRSTKVLLLEDGLPLTYAPYGDNASYYHPPVDRFESVEIVKGSGQILYGPTTVGGVINYVTPAPPMSPSGFVTLMGGNRDYFNGHINYGGTWKNTGLLVDYTRKQGELARQDQRSGLNDLNLKSVTALGMKHALTLKANYYGERSNITYSGLTEAEYRNNPRQSIFRNDFFRGDRFGGSMTHAYVPTNDVTLTTNIYGSIFYRDWWRQSSNSAERPNRLNTLPGGDPDCRSMADLHTTCGNQGRLRDYYVRGVESRVRTNFTFLGVNNEADFGGRLHFETQHRKQHNGDTPNARSGVIVEDNERKNSAYSVFFQNRFLLRDWTITPGVRVEHIKFQRTNRLANGGAGITGRTEATEIVPGIGISYHPTSRLTVFAGVHRGFAPPRTEDIINNATGGSVDLDSELSWNYEVGLRSLPAKGFQLDATFFRMDYENQIVPASLAGGVGSAFTNGGETLHQGVEITGRLDSGTIFSSPHNLYLRTAFTYIPIAKFTGTRFSNVGGFSNVSISGNRLPYAPEQLLNFSLGYSHPKGVDTFLEGVYVGRQFGDDLNTVNPTANGQRGAIPSYTVWNATFNYRAEALRSTFFVTFKNLFDRTYIVDRSRGILPSSPRLVQAGIKFYL
ncbi:MAG TPA: TonB-dependent receptor [Pyrinomonadaceae bacterium]|nr:TonB-dependent receptor [Pyrinomonadaceae bacterium]